MKSNIIMKISSGIATFALMLIFTSCTSEFDKWNKNPNEATPDQRETDNQSTGSPFAQMEHGAFCVGKDRGGSFQIIDILAGGQFGGYFANLKAGYGVGSTHYSHYVLPDGWVNEPFKNAYTEVMQPWYTIKKECDKDGNKSVLALATVVKVLGMSRLSDMYGPIPYSKYGGTMQVAYDSQEDVYKQFFAELDNAIDVLLSYHNADKSATLLYNFDYVYSGNVERWLKFANTLRLRLAMRISYADESLAKAEATKSINSAAGFMTTKDDAAKHTLSSANFTYNNPFWEVTTSWQDLHMGASIDSYMNGYADPRVSSYFVARGGGCYGVRLGLTNINQSSYLDVTSPANIGQNAPVYWMKAAEGYFLRAEAKLRWDLGSETAKSLYEQGITLSFDEAGVSGAASYISNSTSVPADFADKSGNGNDTSARGTVTIAWDDNDNFETKLEKIITQKWIAIYPDGEEAWSEFRRTNYPKLFPTMNDLSGLGLQSLQIRRLRFPTSEYETNNANVTAAATLLGGADNAKSKLWWDKKSH